ncbi:MAG: hypothetical protein ACP5KE_09780, partial [Candidatus Methanodesulfokora sp.]
SSKYTEYVDFPLKDVKEEEEISNAILDASEELWEKEYKYVRKHHDPNVIARMVMKIYKLLL